MSRISREKAFISILHQLSKFSFAALYILIFEVMFSLPLCPYIIVCLNFLKLSRKLVVFTKAIQHEQLNPDYQSCYLLYYAQITAIKGNFRF